ncbi:MAG: hypothetical protein HS122_00920 [Opitutaceae bacterium]|nr:hypothetical protein [Opitutaceae bacterium]
MKLRAALSSACLVLAATLSLFAAPPEKSPALLDTPEINARGRALQEADMPQLQAARSALSSGDITETEIALGGLVKSLPGSAGWHRGMAGELVQLAETSAKPDGRISPRTLFQKAELHLLEAFKKAQTPLQKAGVQIALGALYERRLADRTKAREAYEAAARLAPEFPAATENADRLRRTEAYYQKVRSAKSR